MSPIFNSSSKSTGLFFANEEVIDMLKNLHFHREGNDVRPGSASKQNSLKNQGAYF